MVVRASVSRVHHHNSFADPSDVVFASDVEDDDCAEDGDDEDDDGDDDAASFAAAYSSRSDARSYRYFCTPGHLSETKTGQL